MKFNTEFKNAYVIKRNKLIDVIKGCGDSLVLNDLQIKKIKQKLDPISNLTKEEKRKLAKNHNTDIRLTLSEKKKALTRTYFPNVGINSLKEK